MGMPVSPPILVTPAKAGIHKHRSLSGQALAVIDACLRRHDDGGLEADQKSGLA